MLYKVCGRTSRDDRISFGTGQEPASCDLCATLNPLHMTLQTVNFQRCEHAFRPTSGVSDMPACPPSPAADALQLCPLPPLLLHHERFWPVHSVPSPVPALSASCCAIVLYFSRSCTVRVQMFSLSLCLFLVCYLCEKHYKPITVQFI